MTRKMAPSQRSSERRRKVKAAAQSSSEPSTTAPSVTPSMPPGTRGETVGAHAEHEQDIGDVRPHDVAQRDVGTPLDDRDDRRGQLGQRRSARHEAVMAITDSLTPSLRAMAVALWRKSSPPATSAPSPPTIISAISQPAIGRAAAESSAGCSRRAARAGRPDAERVECQHCDPFRAADACRMPGMQHLVGQHDAEHHGRPRPTGRSRRMFCRVSGRGRIRAQTPRMT